MSNPPPTKQGDILCICDFWTDDPERCLDDDQRDDPRGLWMVRGWSKPKLLKITGQILGEDGRYLIADTHIGKTVVSIPTSIVYYQQLILPRQVAVSIWKTRMSQLVDKVEQEMRELRESLEKQFAWMEGAE